jgi:hypothetical protein
MFKARRESAEKKVHSAEVRSKKVFNATFRLTTNAASHHVVA